MTHPVGTCTGSHVPNTHRLEQWAVICSAWGADVIGVWSLAQSFQSLSRDRTEPLYHWATAATQVLNHVLSCRQIYRRTVQFSCKQTNLCVSLRSNKCTERISFQRWFLSILNPACLFTCLQASFLSLLGHCCISCQGFCHLQVLKCNTLALRFKLQHYRYSGSVVSGYTQSDVMFCCTIEVKP